MRKLAALLVVLFLFIGSGLIGSSNSVNEKLNYVNERGVQEKI